MTKRYKIKATLTTGTKWEVEETAYTLPTANKIMNKYLVRDDVVSCEIIKVDNGKVERKHVK